MELCQSDLDLYIHGNGPRDVEMMLQVTRGLKYLHSIKIVHGDIKPQNILISLDGLPKLADFDCSWHMDKDPPRRTSTLGWQPPECYPIKDVKKSSSSDIFSLGCVFGYFFTGGSHPFGKHPDRIMNIFYNRIIWECDESKIKMLVEEMIHFEKSKRPSANSIENSLSNMI